jgi:hypothetical protein
MDRKEFERTVAKARTEEERLAWFGALLSRESNLEGRLIIVGESAIEIYLTSNEYVSMDIDVVGNRDAITSVLRQWGFLREIGRDRRVYWVKKGLGSVDLVGSRDRSGLPPGSRPTPFGDVLLAPVEYLIVRRLMRAGQKQSTELFRQAEVLAARFKKNLDWDYVRVQADYEKVLPLYVQLRDEVLAKRAKRK